MSSKKFLAMSTLRSEAQISVVSTSQNPFGKFIDKNMKLIYNINIHQKSNLSDSKYWLNNRRLLTIFTVRFIYIYAPYCLSAVGGLNMYKFSNCL